MIGTKELCALLLAGSMGATSVVAVQKAKPSISRQKAGKPKVHKVAQRNVTVPARAECEPRIMDIPAAAPSLSTVVLPDLAPMADQFVSMGSGVATAGSDLFVGGRQPVAVPIAPGIPDAPTWAMMVSGFGVLGLVLRRRPAGFQRVTD